MSDHELNKLLEGPAPEPVLRQNGLDEEFKALLDLLREQIYEQGGTIFSTTECAGTPFRKGMLDAYRHAVHERYRFFSYGDAMLIWPGAT